MIDHGRGNQLADEHKENGISNAKLGRNRGYGQHIKREQDSGKEQMFWCSCEFDLKRGHKGIPLIGRRKNEQM